jgi:dCMP deaminase
MWSSPYERELTYEPMQTVTVVGELAQVIVQVGELSRVDLKLRTFMQICVQLSELSHDPTYKVAAMVVSDDFREICAIGYNGDFANGPNERVNMVKGQSTFIHAEENALLHLGKPLNLRSNLLLLCTHKPCTMCAKRIVNSSIKRVIYRSAYSDGVDSTDKIFEVGGVSCTQFT